MNESGEIGNYRMELPESADWSLLDLYTFRMPSINATRSSIASTRNLPERDRNRINIAIAFWPMLLNNSKSADVEFFVQVVFELNRAAALSADHLEALR